MNANLDVICVINKLVINVKILLVWKTIYVARHALKINIWKIKNAMIALKIANNVIKKIALNVIHNFI